MPSEAGCKVADPAEDRTLITAPNVGATNKPHRVTRWTATPKPSLHPEGHTSGVLSSFTGTWFFFFFFSRHCYFSSPLNGKSMRLDCFYSCLRECSAVNLQQFELDVSCSLHSPVWCQRHRVNQTDVDRCAVREKRERRPW